MEMGALDGLKFSNTYAYEMLLGWRGVHIEASPQSYKVRTCVGVGVTRDKTELPSPVCKQQPAHPSQTAFTGSLVCLRLCSAWCPIAPVK